MKTWMSLDPRKFGWNNQRCVFSVVDIHRNRRQKLLKSRTQKSEKISKTALVWHRCRFDFYFRQYFMASHARRYWNCQYAPELVGHICNFNVVLDRSGSPSMEMVHSYTLANIRNRTKCSGTHGNILNAVWSSLGKKNGWFKAPTRLDNIIYLQAYSQRIKCSVISAKQSGRATWNKFILPLLEDSEKIEVTATSLWQKKWLFAFLSESCIDIGNRNPSLLHISTLFVSLYVSNAFIRSLVAGSAVQNLLQDYPK